MPAQDTRPWHTWRTGTVTFTMIEAHPYHWPIGKVVHSCEHNA